MANNDLALVSPQGDSVPAAPPFHNEGKTVAGWTLAWGLMLAALLVGIGLITSVSWLWIVGLVVGVVALIVSAAMRAAGLGQPPAPSRSIVRSTDPSA